MQTWTSSGHRHLGLLVQTGADGCRGQTLAILFPARRHSSELRPGQAYSVV